MPDDATSQWMLPMIQELVRRDDGDWYNEQCILMSFGGVPAAELATPMGDSITHALEGSDVRAVAMDWVRLGQLIRERLGWYDYPEHPPTKN